MVKATNTSVLFLLGTICSSFASTGKPRRFCGKELLTMHGYSLYDSRARFQHSFPLCPFASIDPPALCGNHGQK